MKHVEVVAAVIKKEGKIFCCQRGPGRELEGFYEFPGGKIKDGETKEAALKREIEEELKSSISVDEYIMTVEHDYPTFHITMYAFYCTLLSGQLDLTEHTNKKWCTINELALLDFAPADIPIVKKVLKSPLFFG